MKSKWFALGWLIVGASIVTTATSVSLEIIAQEPVYLTTMKLGSAGIGIGGIIVGITGRRRKEGG